LIGTRNEKSAASILYPCVKIIVLEEFVVAPDFLNLVASPLKGHYFPICFDIDDND
jgi:hypothetical protein